jgi:hypothetical protein
MEIEEKSFFDQLTFIGEVITCCVEILFAKQYELDGYQKTQNFTQFSKL